MSLIQNTVPNYYGGVSKQADKLMQENVLKEALNVIPSLTEGLTRRPPMEHIAKLTGTLTYHPYIHTVTNDNEEYTIIIDGSTLRIFDLNGNEKTVSLYATTTYDYITTTDPLSDLYITTINDYTFILNKNITVEMDNTVKSTTYNTQALIFVGKGDYDTTYTITVTDSTGGEYQAVYESAASTSEGTATPVEIAEALASNLENVLSNSSDSWEITREGAVIALLNKKGSSFTIKAEDDNTNDDLFAFYKVTGSYDNLPVVAPDGFIIKITGDEASNADDYYIQFHTTDGTDFSDGYWQECADPSLPYMIDGATMPHILYRSSTDSNTFLFSQASWGERIAGDENTCPSPSFIGSTIQEIATHKGRLTFLSEGNWLASDTGDVFQFFKASARVEADSDPIDITSNVGMTSLKHSLPFNGEMLVFSETSCFTLSGGSVFANSTIGCDLTMEYECSSYCKPIKAHKGGFFVFETGKNSKVREVYIDSTYNTNAREITEHIPDYLPKNIYKIIGSTVNNMALFLSTEEPANIYVYKYHLNQDDAKVQSAWVKWSFDGGKIYGGHFRQNLLYLFIEYSDGVYLNVLDFAPKLKDDDLDFNILLDRKIYQTDFETIDNVSVFTLPYTADNTLTITDLKGIPINYTINGVTVTLDNVYDGVIIGNTYTSSFTLPVFYYRTASANLKRINEGLLMIKDVTLYFDDTGYFNVTVTPKASTVYPSTYTYTGVTLGINSFLDTVNITSGSFLFPVMYKNDEVTINITNSTYLPSTFLSVEWLGEFSKRGV